MNYLVVSCTTFDMAGRAMIQGAINGIATLDRHAHFATLEQPQHHRDGWLPWYEEPQKTDEAFRWAHCILDIAGLHTNQGNKYQWMAKRLHYQRPYIFMSQSYKNNVDRQLFAGNVRVIARGKRTARRLMEQGIECVVAPDLSFLVEPITGMPKYRRVFTTHIIKQINPMNELFDPSVDIQLIEKEPQPGGRGTVWEPILPGGRFFYGIPEQLAGIVWNAEEVHTARYQIACYAILAGKKPIIYTTGQTDYDEKYDDLMDYYGKTPQELRKEAMVSCQKAWEAVCKSSKK
jgi:hypothetical protein